MAWSIIPSISPSAFRLRIATAGVLAGLALLAFAQSAAADGILDQTLDGDAGCNTFNYPASQTASGGQNQTFVPSGTAISALDVCVASAEAGAAPITIVVREGSGGAVIGGLPAIAPTAGPKFVHVDFLQALPVTAGQSYSIEIGASSTVSWYGTAPAVDLYSPGSSNSASVGDFAFRVYRPVVAPATSTPLPSATPQPTVTPVPPTETREPSRTPRPTDTPVPGEPTALPVSAEPTAASLPPEPTGAVPPPGGNLPSPVSAVQAVTAIPRDGAAAANVSGRIYLPEVGGGRGSASEHHAMLVAVAVLFSMGSGFLLASRRRG